jgi:hypothetical protein
MGTSTLAACKLRGKGAILHYVQNDKGSGVAACERLHTPAGLRGSNVRHIRRAILQFKCTRPGSTWVHIDNLSFMSII